MYSLSPTVSYNTVINCMGTEKCNCTLTIIYIYNEKNQILFFCMPPCLIYCTFLAMCCKCRIINFSFFLLTLYGTQQHSIKWLFECELVHFLKNPKVRVLFYKWENKIDEPKDLGSGM